MSVFDEALARRVAKAMRVNSPYGHPTQAFDWFPIFKDRALMDELLAAAMNRLRPSQSAIEGLVVLSHWGIPLSILLGHYCWSQNQWSPTYYYYGERLLRHTEELPLFHTCAIMVDDVVNNGSTLREVAVQGLIVNKTRIISKTLLVFVDNDLTPNPERAGLSEAVENGINVWAVTRSSYVLHAK